MAITHDYVDYLDEQIGIAPAGSQEEFQAAQLIADEIRQHGLEPSVEEFDVHSSNGIEVAFFAILLFVGIILSGLSNVALFILGVVITLGAAALFVLKYLNGNNVFARIGSRMRSQNVVAKHEATGELVTKGNRPIVIVAHYDAPHENFLYTTPVAQYVYLVKKYSKYCVAAVVICSALQIFRFLPDGVRIFLWIVGIVLTLPVLVVSVSKIVERFAPCTIGANDNKSSVAAMLGILENVRPTGRRPESKRPSKSTYLLTPPESQGTRRGAEVLESLQILPEDCEIEYVEHEQTEQTPDATETAELKDVVEEGSVEDEVDATMQQVHQNVDKPLEGAETPDDADATIAAPLTGKVAEKNNLARRASLFDLPDPSGDEVDPFVDMDDTRYDRADNQSTEDAEREEERLPETDSETVAPISPTPEAKRRSFKLFGRKDTTPSDDWKGGAATRDGLRAADTSEESQDGAMTDQDKEAKSEKPEAEDLRDAILAMTDDRLISHDIWFVALGASDFDHAGMDNFLSKHRTDIRGAFLINLDCIGAGQLSILKNEGSINTRRADRRMIRMLTTAADNLHIDISTTEYDRDSTDSTQAMRNSVRSVTLMGLDENKLPAQSRRATDVYENVDSEQCVDVAALVTELIRRS